MAKLIKCKICGATIASSAKVCPSCGAKNKKPIFKRWWFWIILIVVAFVSLGRGATSGKDSRNTSGQTSESVVKESREDYIASCEKVDYKDVERNPDTFKGKRIKVTGKVIQVSEGWGDTVTLRIEEDKGNVWYVSYTHKEGESRILENDVITCFGECKGVESYTSVLGGRITIPSLKMLYFE